ncbi:hypothetical protein C7437_1115 [Psychrobacillus insolitus]|uniref:Uncharacterized protein n=1 Tax=Psychrobacillus insolitus TaxID=1461 RepID=A0A2W7P8Y9_9BACI|nr:hypothetical protein [Psychrobacillus insolitus]PZX02413.1 hypothetical protein C7437_1115 [Psychrobacillus insolitus]
MSKIDEIKDLKRQQKIVSPSQVLSEEIKEGNNVSLKVERKRVSFDLRTDIHQELKMQSVIQDKNIYILIEDALMNYLKQK